MTSTIITLTETPPSVNAMYANVRGRGRVKTKAYKAWRKAAEIEVMIQRPRRHTGRVDVLVRLPDRALGDADNRLKPILDLLVSQRVIIDDSKTFVRRTSAEWADIEKTEIIVSPVATFTTIGEAANAVVAKTREAMR